MTTDRIDRRWRMVGGLIGAGVASTVAWLLGSESGSWLHLWIGFLGAASGRGFVTEVVQGA